MTQIQIILAEDHPVVRMSIRNFLEKAPDIEVIGEAKNGEEAYRLTKNLQPDVLLLDLEMPGLSGIEVAESLIREEVPVKIIVLSAHDDKIYVQETLAMGVNGYLTKDEAQEEIVEAVRGVAQDEKGWVSRRVVRQLAKLLVEDGENPDGLTRREMQILQKVVSGKTNNQIAYELGICVKTVEKHLTYIYRKMNVTSRVSAAVNAVRDGIAPPIPM